MYERCGMGSQVATHMISWSLRPPACLASSPGEGSQVCIFCCNVTTIKSDPDSAPSILNQPPKLRDGAVVSIKIFFMCNC